MTARAADVTAFGPARSHIPALDGVRGLAIAVVLFHHFTVFNEIETFGRLLSSVAHLGAAGVDLFFVLSGFLITGILYDAKDKDGYFRNFYARRALRIFPLYYAVLIISLIVLPRVPHPAAQSLGTIENPWWYWLYLSNFEMVRQGQYLHGVLDVTWSLAIEEQFYLLWPLVVLGCTRSGLMRVCLAMIAGALLTRTILLAAGVSDLAVFILTPCRMDGLAIGAWIALAARGPLGIEHLRPAARILAPAGGVVVLGMIVFDPAYYHARFGLSLGLTTLSLTCGALLVLGMTSPVPRSILSARPWRFLGRYSYALYLCHVPIHLLLLRFNSQGRFWPSPAGSVLGQIVHYAVSTGCCVVIALLSWNLFEKHFLKLKSNFATVVAPKPAPLPDEEPEESLSVIQ